MEKLQDSGACVAPTPADVAAESDRIVTMLPNSQHVLNCYTGPNGIFEWVTFQDYTNILI